MKIYFDKYNQPEKPKVYVGTPNNKILCALNGIDESSFSLTPNLNNTWDLSFDVNKYIDVDGVEVESSGYSFLCVLLRIYIEDIGWFLMTPPKVTNTGYKEYKTINASSAEIEMMQHDIKSLKINKGTTDSYEMLVSGNVDKVGEVEFAKEQIKFHYPEKPELSFLDILLKESNMYGWTVGYIDNIPKTYKYYENGELKEKKVTLSNEIGTFDIESQDLYSFLTQDAAQFFSCVFFFDFKNFKISAYRPENIGKDTNINISLRNLQNSNEISVDKDTIYTRYYVSGGNGLTINYVNGDNRIENLDYFKNQKYMSSELIEKYNLWEQDVEKNRVPYIENTRLYNKQLSVVSELKNRVPLDDCSTDWSRFSDSKLLEAQAKYESMKKGYESFYVDSEGRFDEEALKKSPDANSYYQIKDVILPSIQTEIDNRKLPQGTDKGEYIDTYKTDWKLYGLDELEVCLANYQKNKKLAEEAGCTKPYDPNTSTQSQDYHNKMYEIYKEAVKQLDANQAGSCQRAFNERKAEVESAENLLKQYNDKRKESLEKIDKETWSNVDTGKPLTFTKDDLSCLSKLYVDCDYTNENMFLTSSDDSVSAIDEQLKLLDAAKDDLCIASQPQYTYTTSLDNFLSKYEYKNYTDNLNLGDYIYLSTNDNNAVKLRVVSITYNPLRMDNELDITFSNMVKSRSRRDDFAYLLNSPNNRSKTSSSGGSNGFMSNTGIELTPELIQKLLQSSSFLNKIDQIIQGNMGNIVIGNGSISLDELNAKMIKVIDLFAKNGFFEYLQAKLISADKIVAGSGDFKELSALVANIDNLLAGNISGELGHIIHLTAKNVQIDEAVIRDLIASQITVAMLQAGTISANKFNIKSDDGGLEIVGNTMQFKDANGNIRIQIGRDARNNFTFVLYDETGKGVLIDSDGIKESAISDGLIHNQMIANGTISKDKLGFNVAETDENGNIDWGKITANGQGLDVEFGSLRQDITNIENEIQNIGQQKPISVQLDKELALIPCSDKGLVKNGELIEIHFNVYNGLEKVNSTAQIVSVLPSGMTLATNDPSTPTTEGKIIFNIAQGSNLGGKDSGTIAIKFTYENKEMNKTFSWTKLKEGVAGQGDAARDFIIEPDVDTVVKNDKNIFTPSQITFKSFYRDGKETERIPYKGRFLIEESTNGVEFNNKYLSSVDEDTYTFTITNPDTRIIRCKLFVAGTVTELVGMKSVVILSDISKETIENIQTQISGVSSKIDAVEKSITNKVWKTDITEQINSYDGNTVKKLRDQLAEQILELGKITTKVQDVESTFSNGLQSLTEKVSKVEQTAEGFKQEVSKTYATKTEVEDAVSKIKSLQIALSNDNHNILVNSDGTSDYTGCSTTITMIYGTMNVTNQSTFEVKPSEGVTGNWDLQSYTYTVTNMTIETGYVEFIGTYGNRTATKRFNIRKRDREQADFKIYELLCSDSIIQKTSDNKFLPKSITFRSTYKDATSINKNFDGYFKILETEDGTKYTEKYSSVNAENQKLYTPTNKNCKNIVCKLFSDSGFKNELDSQTITVITDAYVDVGVRNLIRNSKTMIFNDYNLIYVKSNYILDEKGNKLTDESGNRLTFY